MVTLVAEHLKAAMASNPSELKILRRLARFCEQTYMETFIETYKSGDFKCEPLFPTAVRRNVGRRGRAAAVQVKTTRRPRAYSVACT